MGGGNPSLHNMKNEDIDKLFECHPEFEGVLSKKDWDFLALNNDKTLQYFVKIWKEHLKRNVKRGMLRKHKMLADDCVGLGKNKAVIAIGAGPSLKRNEKVLRQIYDADSTKPWDERDFIFIACNHMFKPLLNEGFIPDFVTLVDAGDIAMEQLTDNIPASGQNVTLLAGLQCSPKILKRWSNQGRSIRFYITSSDGQPETYLEETGDDPNRVQAVQGGNVLNMVWSLSLKFFRSSVYMVVGNDLSYPLHEDLEERRKHYYADKDYTSNIKNRRDEANNVYEGNLQGWRGIKLSRASIISPDASKRYNIELERVLTTGTLWVYKTWIESVVLANTKVLKFHYYNCSEGGISGVMHRDGTSYDDADSWFLLDDATKRWKTRLLEDAADEFIKAKRAMKWGIQNSVPVAEGLGLPN
jgi:hypothetical protein